MIKKFYIKKYLVIKHTEFILRLLVKVQFYEILLSNKCKLIVSYRLLLFKILLYFQSKYLWYYESNNDLHNKVSVSGI